MDGLVCVDHIRQDVEGSMQIEKTCTKCLMLKSQSEMTVEAARPDGMGSWCKGCKQVSYRARYAAKAPAERRRPAPRRVRISADVIDDLHGHRGRIEPLFWSKVSRGDADQCWPLAGNRTAKGYGHFDARPFVTVRAHRLAFALENGAAPGSALVCHSCDNPPCCISSSEPPPQTRPTW